MKRLGLISILLLLWGIVLSAGTEKSDQLVTEAWKAWEQNDHQAVEEKFISSIKENPDNTRAYLGLSYLYNLQGDYKKSWTAFCNILTTEENFYPYIYSAWLTPGFRKNFDNKKAGIVELLEELTANADSGNVLKAMANEVLGDYYQKRGEFLKSRQYYDQVNSINDWMVIGPFDNISASGYDKAYPPELEFDRSKIYEGKNGIPCKWFPIKFIRDNRWIDFRRYFASYESIFYANNFVYSSKKQIVQIRIGTSGSLKAFLNDELVIQCFDENNNDLDTYIIETVLQAGWNRLLIKVGFSEIEKCNFMARITNSNGEAIDGLKISCDKQLYISHPGAPVKTIDNFAESFFQQKIKQNPDHLENYLLLADCYLRNDKAIEAELVLKQAIKLSPNCVVLYHHLLEAYQRGEKYDEFETTVEKIYTLKKNVPTVLEHKITSYIENDEADKAEQLLKILENIQPKSESLYELYIGWYGLKQQVEKILEFSKEAYQKYPTNWEFVSLEALISIQKTQQYDQAIKIFKKYLDSKTTINALLTLGNCYLKASNINLWEKTYQRAIELDPAGPGYHYQMASIYTAMQDYDKAEQAIKKAIDICPGCSVYWAKLGEIHRIQNNLEKSKQAYRVALEYNAKDYDSRDILRELEGNGSHFSHFKSVNIDSILSHSPNASSYPDDGAVILLDDAKRVVYEKGASEFSKEIIIKVFNNNGIDDFNEYWIDFNSYTQDLVVEKAVVIKNDGSEIKADIDINHIVFKSLEPGDHIHLRWKIKNYYRGKLAHHFWDKFHFNCFYPKKFVRYSLLVPENSILHQTQNMPDNPVKKSTNNGVLYQWTSHDEPAIQYEYGMPTLDDVGKILYISSIKNWDYIVEWYADLARTKARTSYEIKELAQKLFKDRNNCTKKEQIEMVYNYITENIHYSYVPFRQSALIPQKARDVLVSHIGDCKDMSTLCIAILNELDINAYHVLVNTKDEGRNLNTLPCIAFNHCIVAAETEDGLIYLDPTAYNYPMGSLPPGNVGAFSLLIKPGVKEPEYIPAAKLIANNIFRQTIVNMNEDNSILIQEQSTKMGMAGVSMRYLYRDKSQQEKEKKLAEIINKDMANAKLIKLEIENLDNIVPRVQYYYEYKVSNYVTEVNQFKFLKIPWTDALDSNPALSHDNRKYPYCYWVSTDTLVEDIEIHLPDQYQPVDLIKEVKLSSSIADYSLSLTFSEGSLKGKRELNYKKEVISPDEYLDFKKFYNNAIKADNRQILLQKKEVEVVTK